MTELAEFFSAIGVTKEADIRMALRSFIDEYNDCYRQKNRNSVSVIQIAIPAVLNSGLLGAIIPSKRAPWSKATILKSLSKSLPEQVSRSKLESVFDKVSKMVSAEGASGFNRVNDYARIAAHVYGNRKDSILTKQWVHLGNIYKNIKLDDEKSGLQAALYKKLGDVPQYVYAIAGTRGLDQKDWQANFEQVVGFSKQYDQAGKIAERLARELGNQRLLMVGHSKGGGQAAYCALRTGCQAITFNPAGLGITKFKKNSHVDAVINSYVMVKDPLNLLQMVAQLMSVDITADGSVHYLKNDKNSPIREWHGIEGFLRLGGMTDMHRLEEFSDNTNAKMKTSL